MGWRIMADKVRQKQETVYHVHFDDLMDDLRVYLAEGWDVVVYPTMEES